MKITELTYLSRRKTADFSWDEFSATAVLEDGDQATEVSTKLKAYVVGTLNGQTVVTAKKVSKPVEVKKDEPKKVEVVAEELSPQQKAAKTRAANKAKKEAEASAQEAPVVIPTIEEVQNSLRAVATHYKTAAKAVAIIEGITGEKTMQNVSPDKFSAIIEACKKVLEA